MQELTTPFEQHDLVWAKVQHYPWWPGKVRLFLLRLPKYSNKKKSLIFKISFYADPTFCYINQDALIPFEQFRQQLNANFTIDGQLQRAINLANNAFERKKHALQNRKSTSVPIQPISLEPESQMVPQEASKGEQFEQETIPVDFEGENSNGKTVEVKKATQMQNLLHKYKLDKIPVLPKQSKMLAQQEPQEGDIESEEEKVELFDLKKANRKRRIKKSTKRKIVKKRKPVSPSCIEQRRSQCMRRACSILIAKNIEAQTSRQICLKMMEKVQQALQKLNDFNAKKMTEQMVYVKLLAIVSDMEGAWPYEEKLVHLFNSIDRVFYQMGVGEKEEEERTHIIYADQEQDKEQQKTNIIFADEEQVSTLC